MPFRTHANTWSYRLTETSEKKYNTNFHQSINNRQPIEQSLTMSQTIINSVSHSATTTKLDRKATVL